MLKSNIKTVNIITGLNHALLNKSLLFSNKYRYELDPNIVIPQEILLKDFNPSSRSALLSFSKTSYEKSIANSQLSGLQIKPDSFEDSLKKILKSKIGDPKNEIFFLKPSFLEHNSIEDYECIKDILVTKLQYKIKITVILQDVFDLLKFRYLNPDYQRVCRFSYKNINSFFSGFQFEKTLNDFIKSISNLTIIFGSENIEFLNIEENRPDETYNYFIFQLLKKHGILINMTKITTEHRDAPLSVNVQFLDYLKNYAIDNSIENIEKEIKNIQNISNQYYLNKHPKELEISNANKKILLRLRQQIIDICQSQSVKKIMTIQPSEYQHINIFHYFEGKESK